MGLKKRGPLYRRVVCNSLAALACVRFLCASLPSENAPRTVQADVCKVGDGLTVSGFVVFSEQTVGDGLLYPAVSSGQHVSAGQTVAWRYDSETLAACEEKRALADSIAILSAAPTEDAAVLAAVRDYTNEPSGTTAQTLRAALLSNSLAAEERADLLMELRELSAEIVLPCVSAASSGCFSYKTASILPPEMLFSVSPEEFPLPHANDTQTCCLIIGERWYFAALIPADGDLFPSQTIAAAFPNGTQVEMTLERCAESGENRLIVLSCGERLPQVAALSQTEAHLTCSEQEGLYVPKCAVRVCDGKTGVYVLIAGQAKFRRITILFEQDDFFLAAQVPGNLAYLQAGDEILLDE